MVSRRAAGYAAASEIVVPAPEYLHHDDHVRVRRRVVSGRNPASDSQPHRLRTRVAVPLQPRSSASDIPTMPGFPPDGSAVPRQRQQRDPRPVQPATIGAPLNDAPSPEQLRLFARALMATALELHWLPGAPQRL
jgi:hypothetical protein